MCDMYSTEDVTPLEPAFSFRKPEGCNTDMGKERFLSNFVRMRETLTDEQIKEVEPLLMK